MVVEVEREVEVEGEVAVEVEVEVQHLPGVGVGEVALPPAGQPPLRRRHVQAAPGGRGRFFPQISTCFRTNIVLLLFVLWLDTLFCANQTRDWSIAHLVLDFLHWKPHTVASLTSPPPWAQGQLARGEQWIQGSHCSGLR